jgi:hypothetical protein
VPIDADMLKELPFDRVIAIIHHQLKYERITMKSTGSQNSA